jgi:hypothetical protein
MVSKTNCKQRQTFSVRSVSGEKIKQIAVSAARKTVSCRKTLSLAAVGLVSSALPTFAAAGGNWPLRKR